MTFFIFAIMSVFLTAEWRKLVFFNYEIPEQLVVPFLPAHTVLDTLNGKHIISLVGFLFKDTRLKGIKIPFYHTFEEVNLRFYVKRLMPDGTWRRGTVFIKEVVPKAAVTWVANLFYREHYVTLPMQYSHTSDQIAYGLQKKDSWHQFQVCYTADPQPILENSDVGFITEHYFGYTRLSEKRTSEYEVTHPVWMHYPVQESLLNFDFGLVYGPMFDFLNTEKPYSVLLAEGSEISVLARRIIE